MAQDSYDKPDFWSRKAFAQGYPARSVYKLKELNDKFVLLKKNHRILDLGAAPGSWTTFALEILAGTGHVTAIDLSPLTKNLICDNLTFIQGDMTDSAVRTRAAQDAPYDVALCDAAPSTTGNRVVDTTRQNVLVECAVNYADDLVKAGGSLVVKIFQGSSQGELMKTLRGIFQTVRAYKPAACRSGSFETYLIGMSKKCTENTGA
jgi:23S rRNA (uridine2552-2'-O)-methyltransferase